MGEDRYAALLGAAEVVFYSDYVVFAEVVAGLDFDDFEGFDRGDVFDSVVDVAGYEHCFAATEGVLFLADGDFRRAACDNPRFVTVSVPL